MKWATFYAAVCAIPRVEARELLTIMDGTAWGARAGVPIAGGDGFVLEAARERVRRLAEGEA